MSESTSNVRKRPFRVSLLGMFGLITIAALSISLYLTKKQLSQADAELLTLRKVAGHLAITDRSQVYVMAVPSGDGWGWRWRIYLPAGVDFALNSNVGKIGSDGLPVTTRLGERVIGGQSNPNEPREILIDVAMGKTLEGDPCLWTLENGRPGPPITFGKSLPSWADGSRMLSDKIAGCKSQVTVDAATPLVLLALDGDPRQGTRDDAVLIWISPYRGDQLQRLRTKGVLLK